MNSSGVVQRRGFAVLVLLSAVALAAYLVHARLGADTGDSAGTTPAAVEASEPVFSAEGGNDSAGSAADAADADDGYGGGNAAPAPPDDNGQMAQPAAPPPAAVGFRTTSLTGRNVAAMGSVVVDSGGWTLYRFDSDTANPSRSACSGECATKWPPVTVDGDPQISGLDKTKVGKITRDDGAVQLTLNGWPLYRFAGDKAAGKWKGQAVQNTWWVAAANGSRNLSCLPAGAKPPAAKG